MTSTAVSSRLPAAAPARRRLRATTRAAASLDARSVADAFALFHAAYDGADRARFERDLAEKQYVILLRDAATGALKGFSTVLVQSDADATVVFSGDTVIDREYWGQKALQSAFARLLLDLRLRAPRRPLYWFLISKGYRTYLLLANAFPVSLPRRGALHDAALGPRLDALAAARFGARYDRATRVVRNDGTHERVRGDVAPVAAAQLANAHVRFFVERNPGHADGDELACLASVRFRDLARVPVRVALARLARAFVMGSEPMNGAAAANRAYLAWSAPARLRFERALADPERAQHAALDRVLRRASGSAFGRAHGLAPGMGAAAFRDRVAPRTYDDFAADVERVAAGERAVLTDGPVRCLEPTGGSSGASKLVPYTPALLEEFSAATVPWIHDLLRNWPALRGGRAYWAVTPPGPRPERTAGGVPVGLEHDSDYFPAFVRALLDRVLGAPRALGRAPSVDACRYLTLRALLALPDLAFVSVWSPSFLTLMADSLDADFGRLLHDMERGTLGVALEPTLRAELERALPARPARAAALRAAFGVRAPEDLGAVWPALALVSCWTDAHAARALSPMRARFPDVEVQGKGLMATEGVVSVPLYAAGGAVAAVGSHFLEFVPEGGGDARLAHELEEGRTYEVLLTTSGGFYRYRLRDLVRVDGWYRRTPVLAFHGRADGASDLAGEKLTPAFVERALDDASDDTGVTAPFAMVAPAWGAPPRYELFVECDAARAHRVAAALEVRLRASHHYALCRSLGQLGPVRGVSVRDGERAYERGCVARGQRAGAIKPTALDARLDWSSAFAAAPDEVGVA